MMNPMAATKKALTRILDYRGRSSRAEFWWFTFIFIGSVIMVNQVQVRLNGVEAYQLLHALITNLSLAFYTPFLLAFISLTVRRLHDTERSGWWILLICFNFAALFLIYMLIRRGTPGPNKFDQHLYNKDIDWSKVERF